MNLILIDQREITGHTATLTDRRAKHIRKTLRSKIGDTVRVGIINGKIGTGLILKIEPGLAVLQVATTNPPPPKTPTSLIIALPRPIMLKRTLAQAASLGLARIYLINANRVEKSFFKASLLAEDNLRECLLLGLEQGVDTKLPEISVHHRFRPFVEDYLSTPARNDHVKLIAHPGDAIDLTPRILPASTTPILIAIGPEGGWVDFEIDLFRQQGFSCFSLGPRILRVDTAVPAILAQLQLLRALAARN